MPAEEGSRSYWVDDKYATRCFACAKKFNFIRRKHHCRACGQVFCTDCLKALPESPGVTRADKMCAACQRNRGRPVTRSMAKRVSRGISPQEPVTPHKFHASVALSGDAGNRMNRPEFTTIPVLGTTPREGDGSSSSASTSSPQDDIRPLVLPSVSREASQEVSRSSIGALLSAETAANEPCIEDATGPEFTGVTCALQKSLAPLHFETDADREVSYCMSEVPLIARFEMAEWVKAVKDAAAKRMVRIPTPVPRARTRTYIPCPNVTFRIEAVTQKDVVDVATTFFVDKHQFGIIDVLQDRCATHLELRCQHLIHESNASLAVLPSHRSRSKTLSPSASQTQLDRAAEQERVGTIDSTTWADALCDLSWKVVSQTVVDRSTHILNNVDILCIDGGELSDTEIVPGIAFCRNVAHKKMRTRIECPRMLLLGGDVGSPPGKLTMDLVEYAETYPGWLEKLYSRIRLWRPHLILVERTMHHFMQESVINDGITLVTNVSREVLERLERSTDAHIINDLAEVSISDLQEGTYSPIGSCSTFAVNIVADRPVIMLTGFARPTFTTVVLRGSTVEMLQRIKAILMACVSVAFHLAIQAHYFVTFEAIVAHKMEAEFMSPRSLGENLREFNLDARNVTPESLSMNMGVLFPSEVFSLAAEADSLKLIRDNVVINTTVLESQGLRNVAGGGENPQDTLTSGGSIERQIRVYPFYDGEETLYDYLCERMSEGDSTRLLVHGNRRVLVKTKTDGKDFPPVATDTQSQVAARAQWRRSVHPPSCYLVCKECRARKVQKPTTDARPVSRHLLKCSFGAFLEMTIYASEGCLCACGHNLHGDVIRCFVLHPTENSKTTVSFDVEPLRLYSIRGPPPRLQPILGENGSLRSPSSMYLELEKDELHHHVDLCAALWRESNPTVASEVRSESPALRELAATPVEIGSSPTTATEKDGEAQQSHAKTSLLLQPPPLPATRRPSTPQGNLIENLRAALQPVTTWEDVAEFRGMHLDAAYAQLLASTVSSVRKKVPKMRQDGWAYCVGDRHATIRLDEPSSMICRAIMHVRRPPSAAVFAASPADSPLVGHARTTSVDVSMLQQPLRPAHDDSAVHPEGRRDVSVLFDALEDAIAEDDTNSSSKEAPQEDASGSSPSAELARVGDGSGSKQNTETDMSKSVMSEGGGGAGGNGGGDGEEEEEPPAPTMEDIVGQRGATAAEAAAAGSRFTFKTEEEAIDALAGKGHAGREVLKYSEDFVAPEDGSRHQVVVELLFPRQFAAMRYLYTGGSPDNMVESLLRCRKHNPGGGKSGSTFVMTSDERFLLKQVKVAELRHFFNFGPAYFAHMTAVFAANHSQQQSNGAGSSSGTQDVASLLVKIFGVFSVQTKKRARLRNIETERCYYILMENLLYNEAHDVLYDLKGSQRKRLVPDDAPVLLDENLVQLARKGFFFFCSEEGKSWTDASLSNDAHLLSTNNIMDYSLIVAVNAAANSCTIGIIDYLHPYSVDKVIESKVKTGMENIFGTNKDPTIIDPTNYKQRFLKWMGSYFCGVPEKVSQIKRHNARLRKRRAMEAAAAAAAQEEQRDEQEAVTDVAGNVAP